MDVDTLISYARQWRAASDLPAGTAVSMVPLMLSEQGLAEMVDGTELTVEQWLRAAYSGIMVIPDELWFGKISDAAAAVSLGYDSITGYPDHYIVNGNTSSCDCGGHDDVRE